MTPHILQRFMVEEDGQTLVEYGLLISLIALVVIVVLTLMGRRTSNVFEQASLGMEPGQQPGKPGAGG